MSAKDWTAKQRVQKVHSEAWEHHMDGRIFGNTNEFLGDNWESAASKLPASPVPISPQVEGATQTAEEPVWEHIERLKMMVDPKQSKWDLSPNDVAAISTALALIRNYVPDERLLEGR